MGLKAVDLENRYLFQTEYVIWDNMDLPVEDGNLSAYQIGAKVLDMAGIHEGTMIRYHQARRRSKNYQRDLEVLQYDILYGEQYVYGGENPWKPVNMKMGTGPVVLNSVQKASEDIYYFRGEGFTAFSRVELDGELREDTVYVGTDMLMLQGVSLKEGEQVRIAQVADGQEDMVLSRSRGIRYRENEEDQP